MTFDIHLPLEIVQNMQQNARNIFLTHVPDNLESESMIKEYDLLIFGHTHNAEVKKIGGSVIVNPGEAGGWLYGKATIAIADLESLSVKIISL